MSLSSCLSCFIQQSLSNQVVSGMIKKEKKKLLKKKRKSENEVSLLYYILMAQLQRQAQSCWSCVQGQPVCICICFLKAQMCKKGWVKRSIKFKCVVIIMLSAIDITHNNKQNDSQNGNNFNSPKSWDVG